MAPSRLALALAIAAAVAAVNYAVAERLASGGASAPILAWLVLAPVALALIVALALPGPVAPSATGSVPAPPAVDPQATALRLLADLQRDGRLVDFLSEDLSPHSNEQIGAAVRGIHDGCRKTLRARVELTPVLGASEGETVTLEAGFDAAAVRLTGNVGGTPPYRGVVRHAGWRATRVELPAGAARDALVIAPAEVEIA